MFSRAVSPDISFFRTKGNMFLKGYPLEAKNSPKNLKLECTVKPVLSGHSKTDKTKVLKTNGRLMTVESIAECSKRAFCNTFDLH